jgi:hypothetical protein
MKNFFLLALILSLGMGINVSSFAQENNAKSVIDVYYFHSTHRCAGCMAIENSTKELLKEDFAQQVKNGEIKLHILNLDDDKNSALVEKYELWGSSLLVVKKEKNKEEEIINRTQDGFSYARTTPGKFKGILKEDIDKMLAS